MQKLKTAFVLGAGLGTRLRPLTNSVPKPMLPVRGRPLAARIFDSLLRAGVARIIINTHHAAGKYAEYFTDNSYKGAELAFVHEPELLDTGGGLKNILPLLEPDEPILVYNGDILFGGELSDFVSHFENAGADASLLLREQGDVKNVAVRDGFVCDMRGILGSPFDSMKQFCGIFAASPNMLEAFAAKDKRIFSTVEVLVEFMKEHSNSVCAYEDNSDWSDIGTMEEYSRLK